MVSRLEYVLNAFQSATGCKPRKSGNGWMCRCPAHDDQNPSLAVSEGDDGRVLVHCHAGCELDGALTAAGLSKADLFPHTQNGSSQRRSRRQKNSHDDKPTYQTCADAVAFMERRHGPHSRLWLYQHEDGSEAGAVVRWDLAYVSPNKRRKRTFPLARVADGWIIGGMPELRPLFHLPETCAADPVEPVYVVEGEKVADVATSLGFLTTTSSGGSCAANQSDWTPLAGRDVVILPDRDKPGRMYADSVAAILTGLAPPARVRVVDLSIDWPELPEKGDLADWSEHHDAVEPGVLRDRIQTLVDQSPEWEPPEPDSVEPWTGRRAVLQSFADVKPERLRWLWPGRFPLGMLSLVSGNPEAGKSFLMVDLIARVTTGAAWPDGGESRSPGGVILLNAEDSVAVCQRPRLDAAGADPGRVKRIVAVDVVTPELTIERRSFSIVKAATDLRDAARQVDGLRLIVLDPLAAFLAGVRANDQGEIRGALSPLVELAEELDVAIVFVHHNRKGTGAHSSERLAGSLQIGATMRQIWEVYRDPDDHDRRLFVPGKNSNARDRGGLAFRVVDSTIPLSESGDDFVGRVEWLQDRITLSADDVALQAHDDERDPWPMEWLRDHLREGPQPSRDVLAGAKREGISEKQLRTARKRLGVRTRKAGFSDGWVCELPAE